MKDSFKVLREYYPDWTGEPKIEYHMGEGELPFLLHLSSDNYEARVAAAVSHEAVQEKKTVLILAPKKEFFPLLLEKLIQKQVPHNC